MDELRISKSKSKNVFIDKVQNAIVNLISDNFYALKDLITKEVVTIEIPSSIVADTIIKSIDFSPFAKKLNKSPVEVYSETRSYLNSYLKNHDLVVNGKIVFKRRSVVGKKYNIYVYLPRLKGLYVPKHELPSEFSHFGHKVITFDFKQVDLLENQKFISSYCPYTKVAIEEPPKIFGTELKITYSASTSVVGKTHFMLLHDEQPNSPTVGSFFVKIREKLTNRNVLVVCGFAGALIAISDKAIEWFS